MASSVWVQLTPPLLKWEKKKLFYGLFHLESRHGPKPGSQETEAFSILEAEAFTHFKLEVEALVQGCPEAMAHGDIAS